MTTGAGLTLAGIVALAPGSILTLTLARDRSTNALMRRYRKQRRRQP